MSRLAVILSMIVLGACGGKKAAPKAEAKPAAAASAAASKEPLWLLRDNGKRCIVAPCPSWSATNVDTRETVEISKIDFAAMKLSSDAEAQARANVQAGQQWARGTIALVPKMGPGGDGQVLNVSAVLDATGKPTP